MRTPTPPPPADRRRGNTGRQLRFTPDEQDAMTIAELVKRLPPVYRSRVLTFVQATCLEAAHDTALSIMDRQRVPDASPLAPPRARKDTV